MKSEIRNPKLEIREEDRLGPGWAVLLALTVLFWFALGVAIVLFASGCAPTVRPLAPQAKTASFDGGQNNSGLIAIDLAHNGILTPHARDRYNGLVSRYGERFSPVVHQDEGISPTLTNTFLLDAQHLAYFAAMQRWKRQDALQSLPELIRKP